MTIISLYANLIIDKNTKLIVDFQYEKIQTYWS